MKRTLHAAVQCVFWSLPLWTPTLLAAQEENLFDRLDTNKDGQVAADEVDEERRRLFERLVRVADKNSDGKLSREEFAEGVKAKPAEASTTPGNAPANLPNPRDVLARFDKNNDGKLDKEEAPERLKENFDRVDANKDGAINPDELRQAFQMMARQAGAGPSGRPSPEMLERMFTQADKNNDGKLSRDEIPAERREMLGRLLERLDNDGDGAVTKEQFLRAMQQRMADGERRPNGKPEGKPNAVGRPGAKPEGRPEGKPESRPAAGAAFAPPLLSALDANKDGEISTDEIEQAAKALRSLDQNGDGKLTREELAPRR